MELNKQVIDTKEETSGIKYIHCTVWDEITYPVWEWVINFLPYSNRDVIFFHAGIKVDPCY